MDLKDRTVLILGGWGLVGSAIADALVPRGPRVIVLHSLRRGEAEEAVASLARLYPGAGTRFVPSWGDVFVRAELKDRTRPELLADRETRALIIADTMDELSPALVRTSCFYQLLQEHRPDVVIDCINTATAFAYQDVFYSVRKVQKAVALVDAGEAGAEALRDAIENHLTTLYLLARTPDAPVVKEIKPSAAIAWKRIGSGPVLRQGRPIQLYDCAPERAMDVAAALEDGSGVWEALGGGGRVLESVFVDTGENGMFSSEEFETVTALGQMEFVTPEEIATLVLIELEGGTTGREVVSALDGATLGPTYRAGVMRHRALQRMRRLEEQSGHPSIAFEMLGPPRLSKLLYEAHLLALTCGSLQALAGSDPRATSDACTGLVTRDVELRARILSIGIPILLPDGRLLRGPEMKIPPYKEEARESQGSEEAVERWAQAGWVDLRPANFKRWRDRARAVLGEIDRHPTDDTSSRRFEDREYWRPEEDLPVGRMAAWILGVEDGGARVKPL